MLQDRLPHPLAAGEGGINLPLYLVQDRHSAVDFRDDLGLKRERR
ncbi:MAG: hypothetical protein VKS61_02275 [Candidatus Sericytochromatia bacterium]|nr:hypothetical protein [Candidatus Sericytochromatia bacterium]